MRKTLADFEQVYSFFTRDDFVGDITDDAQPDMFQVVRTLLQSTMVLMPSPGTAFVAKPINSTLFEVHLNTTHEEKADVYKNTLKAIDWAMENTAMQTLLSYIPETCGATLHYAEGIGMARIGVIPDGFVKDGCHVGNVIMSASIRKIKKELSWRQQQ